MADIEQKDTTTQGEDLTSSTAAGENVPEQRDEGIQQQSEQPLETSGAGVGSTEPTTETSGTGVESSEQRAEDGEERSEAKNDGDAAEKKEVPEHKKESGGRSNEHPDSIPTAGGEQLGKKHWGESKVVPDNPKPQEVRSSFPYFTFARGTWLT